MAIRKDKNSHLCKLEDLPKHLQFNKNILTGYRRPMSNKECVHSWTYLHNESFNCYSHCKLSLDSNSIGMCEYVCVHGHMYSSHVVVEF